ncbi:MAG: hypothetical protein Q8S96_04350 [Hydrogenophaga sp.]|uniref:hypothetical protein n=1 Tax=Hydrogenophaga sp. TaxID=1904254 RepID=UPI00271D74D4|nr:hypothetical protein [Hydrogenophaga sp.]MDO9483023.1 hypothetical protein [Hydrogenophaga sp.]MDP3343676.1 hypothetical protein [Hydrogenophaga sp.]MDP3807081.1 hypothetical protein [Hydrogenophaga sp.]MDP3926639.1 hypothetical protein [Hydrogenophaga sp.]MDZ4240336.1 hypothetical protein [Hydrogenophaga sp.]
MQSHYAETFERDMGCTEAEWLGWLPAAIGSCAWQQDGQSARVNIVSGALQLRWQPMPPRVIALMRMPVLRVGFAFSGLDSAQRYVFMKRFDLYMQRGGG